MANDFGARIKSGASNWQIFQQDSSGKAIIHLKGAAFVHNGFGVDPQTSIHEAVSLRPLLAFYRFRIQ